MQPYFLSNGRKFQLISREGAISYDMVVVELMLDGSQVSRGGTPDTRSVIVEDYDDATIMAHGSRREFILWAQGEAMRRANIRTAPPAVPDPTSQKTANVNWNVNFNQVATPGNAAIAMPAPPLP